MTTIAFELAAVKEFVYNALTNDSTMTALVAGRVYDEIQPDSAGWPLVILQVVASTDTLGTGATRILTRSTVRVKAITKGAGMQSGLTIASAIDAALHKVNGTFDGHYVTCHRVSTFSYSESTLGETFKHVGAEFRIDVHPTA